MIDVRKLSGSALAYFGDSVLEILARERALSNGFGDVGQLNEYVMAIVTAKVQSQAMDNIENELSEEEIQYFKLGRNAHVKVPKSASSAEYHRATGMEALFAYLYLTEQKDRLKELFNKAYPNI